MGLVTDHAVDHMSTDSLQTTGPVNISLLIKPSQQFNHDRHLLPLTRRINEGFHDHRIGSGTIDRLLDSYYARVHCSLLDEMNYRLK